MLSAETAVEITLLGKLTRDVRTASVSITAPEARYLVDTYYQMQDNRKRAGNQVKAMETEPHETIALFHDQAGVLERQVRSVLDSYSSGQPLGAWAKSIVGIGPVIAAGLLAHIDLNKAPTVGHIWRIAGVDPSRPWIGREAATRMVSEYTTLDDAICGIAPRIGLRPSRLLQMATTDKYGNVTALNKTALTKAISKRPWNASLKTLVWKIGESFKKVSGKPEAFYGGVYRDRKVYETAKNLAGDYANQATEILSVRKIGRDKDTWLWYAGCLTPESAEKIIAAPIAQRSALTRKLSLDPGEGLPMLTPGHIMARAQRYAAKLFLAHYHEQGFRLEGKEPPLPYPIAMLDHEDRIPVPVS